MSAPLQAPIVATEAVTEPFNANGAADGWRCACGAGAHPLYEKRCAKGHARLDNDFALQNSVYARVPPAEVREPAEQLVAGIISDLGGENELSTIERGYIEKLGAVDITLRLLAHDITERGLLTPSGGVRRVHESFLAAVDRWDRLAQRLGTKRRAKPVTFAAAVIAAGERQQ